MFQLKPSEYLSQNEIDAADAGAARGVQHADADRVVWPPSTAVARAYVDQLTRSNGIQPDRVRAVAAALDRADGVRTGKEKNAEAVIDQLDTLAGQLERDAAAASGRDAARLKALAEVIKERGARLRS